MILKPSGYESFDALNQVAATSPVKTQKTTKFGSAITSINDLLRTATDTLVTVDGVINKGGNTSGNQHAPHVLYPGQGAAPSSGSNDMMKYAAIAGVAIGGGIILLKVLKK